MTTRPAVEVAADAARNLLSIRFLGCVTSDGLKSYTAEIESLLPGMKAGFTVLTDLTQLDSMDLDCVPHLTRVMDLTRASGVGTVIRVIPDRTKDIGFNILSIIHYRSDVRIVTCDTLVEAERALTS